jgi:hypothetical protein
MEENIIPKKVFCMILKTTWLRGRPRNRWQDEVREDGRIVGGKRWKKRIYKRGMEEAPENGKESSHSAQANGMNE